MATVKTLLGYVKGPKGDTGEQGVQGIPGNDGTSATINVGSVTTAASGTPARVTNSGTTRDAIFDFVIPQGQPGSVGEIAGYPVNEITASGATWPVPIVGDTVSTIVGKQAKLVQDTQDGLNGILGDFASIETGTNASKAYSVGQYLVKDGKLYRVTAAIAQGNALNVGGNLALTTVGAEISSLNTELSSYQIKTFSFGLEYDASTVFAARYGFIVPVANTSDTRTFSVAFAYLLGTLKTKSIGYDVPYGLITTDGLNRVKITNVFGAYTQFMCFCVY